MGTSRRVFLEVLGGAAAAGCGGIADGQPASTGSDAVAGSGGSTGGSSGSAASTAGSGGSAPSTAGSGGSGGTGENTGGSGGTAGQGGSGDGGAPRIDAGRPVEAGPPVLQPGDIAAGNVSALAVQALRVVGQNVGIGRDASGVYAMTLICTHQGCGVTPTPTNNPTQLVCPCHGSRFDRNGAVTNGPATRALVHYAVDVDAAGNIVIHTRMTVAATTRTAVA